MAVEQPAPEVGEQAEGVDVGTELVDHPGQLVDLVGRVELGLVAHQVVQAAVVLGVAPASSNRSSLGPTSTAAAATPSRLDTWAPSRSRWVHSRPRSPGDERLWWICRARVDLPEPIVPNENRSVAMAPQTTPV